MPHTGTCTLETPRLILRRHRLSDAEDMFVRWTSDPVAARFWTWQLHKTVDETRAIIAQWLPLYDSPTYYHWLIAGKQDDRPLGYIYLDDVSADGASMHYLICRANWNQGLATEAGCRVIDHAFGILGMHILHSRHHIANPASGRVLQKCGFIRTHSDVIYHHYRIEKR